MIENIDAWYLGHTTQKMKLSVNYFFSKYEQIRIWFVQIYYRNSQRKTSIVIQCKPEY